MAFVVTLHLAAPTCAATGLVGRGRRLRCIGLGGRFGAYGLMEGPAPAGFESLEGDPRGLGALPAVDCSACPVRLLPPGMRPLSAEVQENGVRLQILVEDEEVVADALRRLREAGQGPRRVATRPDPAPASGFTVPWGALTARQRETLEIAAELGCFDPGGPEIGDLAHRLGVSRSTAHEHLQKGISRLLQAMFQGP